jgi:hypothetical protein
MKILRKYQGRTQVVYEVELEAGEDTLPPMVLISMADGESKERALVQHQVKAYRHFGGNVSIHGCKATITVYID